MTAKEQLIEQQIRAYESRLKHIDELFDRAHKATEHLEDTHDSRSELSNYAAQRLQLERSTDPIKTMPVADWREETLRSAGPMAVWDILAQKLEEFLERHE